MSCRFALCALILLLAPGALAGQSNFIRGDLDGVGDGPGEEVTANDVQFLSNFFLDPSTGVGGGCDLGGNIIDAADVNDNSPDPPSPFALGPTEKIITIADLLQMKAKVDDVFTALPPPAMCDGDSISPSSSMEMDGSMAIVLEPGSFDGGQQEVVVKLSRTTSGLQGVSLAVHGVGMALHVDPSVTAAAFAPAFASAPEFLFVLSPSSPGNLSDMLVVDLGSLAPLGELGAAELVLGTITLSLPAAVADPLALPADIDADGFPDPVQVGARTVHTTVVERIDGCFEAPGSGLLTPCFADRVPSLEGTVTAPDEFRRSDANGDGMLDIADGVFLLQHLFLSGAAPSCAAAADFDGSGRLAVGDAIGIFGYQLLNGPAPAAPFPSCGAAPGGEPLGCESYSPTLCD